MAAIPYVRQNDFIKRRMCGGAALAMVYTSLGLTQDQERIWQRIEVTYDNGTSSTRTMKICEDALAQGLHATIIKAQNPLSVLQCCDKEDVRVILNHQLREHPHLGHYTVLSSYADNHVILQDPQLGPNQKVTHGQLLMSWQANGGEITGNILVAITNRVINERACSGCSTVFDRTVICQACNENVDVEVLPLIGCPNPECSHHSIQDIICPFCDKLL